MKEETSRNVVEVRRKSDKVMVIVLISGREVMQIICGYGPQSGRPDTEKVRFYDEVTSGTLEVLVKSLFLYRISMGMQGNVLRVLKVCIGGMVLEKKSGRKIAGVL